LPKEIEKHYFKYFFGSFRNVDTKIARKERDLEILKEEQTHATNLKADSINHVYIPKDLNDCFIQLNKILKPIDIEKIKSSKGIDYHMGLGMWIRNNWGLWGGSRLQQYFIKKGYDHPDSMSSIILASYIKWLNGDSD